MGLFFCLVHVAQKVVLHSKESSGCSRGDADLIVDVLDMVMNGAFRDRESFCHLAIGMPASDQPEDFDFTVTQPCYPGVPCRAHAMTCYRQHGSHGFIIKQSRPYLATQFGKGLIS